MPYQPDLIPKEHRVLPDYFNSRSSAAQPGNKVPVPILPTIVAVVLFLLALFFFKYFLLVCCSWLRGSFVHLLVSGCWKGTCALG